MEFSSAIRGFTISAVVLSLLCLCRFAARVLPLNDESKILIIIHVSDHKESFLTSPNIFT